MCSSRIITCIFVGSCSTSSSGNDLLGCSDLCTRRCCGRSSCNDQNNAFFAYSICKYMYILYYFSIILR